LKKNNKRAKEREDDEEVKLIEGDAREEARLLKDQIAQLQDQLKDYDFLNEENEILREKMEKLKESGVVNENGEEIIKF
jgi:uncharacterized protein YlxW (UPF0749 family)